MLDDFMTAATRNHNLQRARRHFNNVRDEVRKICFRQEDTDDGIRMAKGIFPFLDIHEKIVLTLIKESNELTDISGDSGDDLTRLTLAHNKENWEARTDLLNKLVGHPQYYSISFEERIEYSAMILCELVGTAKVKKMAIDQTFGTFGQGVIKKILEGH